MPRFAITRLYLDVVPDALGDGLDWNYMSQKYFYSKKNNLSNKFSLLAHCSFLVEVAEAVWRLVKEEADEAIRKVAVRVVEDVWGPATNGAEEAREEGSR